MTPQRSLRRWECWQRVIGVVAAGAALGGCSVERPAPEKAASARAALEKGWESMTLAWGNGAGQVGLRPAATDLPAEGPSAIAVGPWGEVLVLDRLNDRIVEISPAGAVHTRTTVARDAEHLAVGPDGATAAWSPLRATVWIAAHDGSPLGEVAIARELRDVQRIDLGISRRVIATTSMQETLQLGSPRAPLDLAATLRTTREGAAFLQDGRGVAARADSGAGEIVVYRKVEAHVWGSGSASRSSAPSPGKDKDTDSKVDVSWTFPIEGKVASVRIVGTSGNAICARVERVTQTSALAVEREALCVEADTGAVLLKRALGRPGLYTLHEELSVGGAPAVLAFVKPEAGGLRVERVALATNETEVAK